MTFPAQNVSRRTVLGQAVRLAIVAPLLGVLGCNDTLDAEARTVLAGETMGTYYRVTIIGNRDTFNVDQLQAGIEQILADVIVQMSTYKHDSELSRFNAASDVSWVEMSPDVIGVIMNALEVSRKSDSAFDPTIGPLVNLWGFGPTRVEGYANRDARIHAALPGVGHSQLNVGTAPFAVRKTHPNLQVDLSGIGKGFAVDRVADYLERNGAAQYLVDIGGDMRAHRRSPMKAPWKIGIEKPVKGRRTVHRVINVGEGAVATSGNYRNFFESGGSVYSHIIDPRTGNPVKHGLASVTVVASTAEMADAWSTALMVLGPGDGFALAEREGLAAFFIERADGRLVDRPSREFRRFFTG